MTDQQSGREMIAGLDGLRAVAATMVFIFHAHGHAGLPVVTVDLPGGQSLNVVKAIGFGSLGVALFFVLSGFLLSRPYWQALLHSGPPVDVRHYLLRRLARIYPAYVVAVIIYALLHDTQHSIGVRAVHVVTHLLLVHNLTEATVYNISAPLWSVATEFQLYLFLPVVFIGVGWLAAKVRPAVLAGVVLIASGLIGVAFYWAALWLLRSIQIDSRLIAETGYVLPSSPLVGLAHFGAGVAGGYVSVRWGQAGRSHSRTPLVASLSFLVVLILLILAFSNYTALGLPPTAWPTISLAFAGLVVLTGLSVGGLTAGLSLAPIRFLGTISYSFYLYHDFVLYNVYNRFPESLAHTWLDQNVVKGLIAYGVTIIVAWLSYRLIEQPGLRRLAR